MSTRLKVLYLKKKFSYHQISDFMLWEARMICTVHPFPHKKGAPLHSLAALQLVTMVLCGGNHMGFLFCRGTGGRRGHISGLSVDSGSALSGHTWWAWRDHVGCQGLNCSQPCAWQAPSPLSYHASPKHGFLSETRMDKPGAGMIA